MVRRLPGLTRSPADLRTFHAGRNCHELDAIASARPRPRATTRSTTWGTVGQRAGPERTRSMATVEECRSALQRFSAKLGTAEGELGRATRLDRTLSCR